MAFKLNNFLSDHVIAIDLLGLIRTNTCPRLSSSRENVLEQLTD
jgi:hypothetical protein